MHRFKTHLVQTWSFLLMWSYLLSQVDADCIQGLNCPDTCICSLQPFSGKLSVNCSSRNLQQIPNLPFNTVQLLASNNSLTKIPKGIFKDCTILVHLDLSKNRIKDVHSEAFSGLEQLDFLNLNTNKIDFSNVSARLWQNLTNLSVLLIHNNPLPGDVKSYNDQLFSPLTNLRNLTMDGLENATFGSGFGALEGLEYFRLTGKVQYVTNSTFEQFENSPVKTLVVSSGVLTDVEKLAFGHFTHLETLDLSFNHQLGFHNVSKAWYGLQFTNITTIRLVRAVPFDSKLITIDCNFLRGLHKTNLSSLFLDANNINIIDACFKENTPSLRHLSLAYNRLVWVLCFMLDIASLNFLEVVDVSFQSKRPLIPSRVTRDTNTTLDVSSPGGRIENTTVNPPKISICNIRSGDIKSYPVLYDPVNWRLPLARMLRVVNLAATLTIDVKVLGRVTLFSLFPTKSRYMNLESFNFSLNNVRELKGPLTLESPLKKRFTFDFSSNRCYLLDPNAMEQIGPSTRAFYFGHNDLGRQLASDYNGTVLQHLRELWLLDLSWNNIKTLPFKVFANQERLKNLNLRYNSLRLLSFDFSHMANLSSVDLSGNILNQLEEETRSKMDLLATRHNLTVDLTGNPLECSCDSLPFLKWVSNTEVHLQNYKHYACHHKGHLVPFANLENVILADLNSQCRGKLWVIVLSCVLAVIVLVVGISIFLRRHRYEIRYWCLRSVFQRKKYKNMIGENRVFDLDAYVSFDEEDKAWIDDHLIASLDSKDGQGPYKLLVQHRDLLPNEQILNYVYNGIEKSRRTILVVSGHYFENTWCREELEIAHSNSSEEHKELPLIIFLESDLSLLKFPRTMRRLLKRTTCVKWPEGVDERTEFWEKVKVAMAPRPNEVVRRQDGETIV